MKAHQIINIYLKFQGLFIITGILLFVMNSCYYDNEEELYLIQCDTTNVTYFNTIAPIIESNCNTCHSQSAQFGGIITEDYNNLRILADNGKLWGAITHTGPYPMPKNGNKLSDCKIKQIKTWIDQGTQNN